MVFRLQRLEMANLVAAVALLVVLRAEPLDMAVRVLFSVLLNALSYLNNDYLDVRADLQAKDRNNGMTQYLAENMGSALLAQWGLVAAMAIIALVYDPGLIVPLVLGGGVCVAYSAKLKATPIADIAAMTVWGAAMPAVAFPMDATLGWALACQLGLFSTVFESLQVLRDRRKDAEEGIRTTAVVLGPQMTRFILRAAMAACALYAAAILHPLAGTWMAFGLLLPVHERSAARDWTRVKIIYGIAWLGICAQVYFTGRTAGLWLQCGNGL